MPPGDPSNRTWTTRLTRVATNRIELAGYPLQEIIGRTGLLETTYLLHHGDWPSDAELNPLRRSLEKGADGPCRGIPGSHDGDVSRGLCLALLVDESLGAFGRSGEEGTAVGTAYVLGRFLRYLTVFFQEKVSVRVDDGSGFGCLALRAMTGRSWSPREGHLFEAALVACADHGVTAPSTQACILASSVRAPPELALAAGITSISEVHGGAGCEAARFFRESLLSAQRSGRSLTGVLRDGIASWTVRGARIPGLGHRVHTEDPRCWAIWRVAEETGLAGDCLRSSQELSDLFAEMTGKRLPVNVDGVLGALVADLDLDPRAGKACFILGRVAGLSAHYAEEKRRYPRMRRISFADAEYAGPATRHLGRPGGGFDLGERRSSR